MELRDLILSMRTRYDGWGERASAGDFGEFLECTGILPAEILELYEDHNGTPGLPSRGDAWLPVRLMPMLEAMEVQAPLAEFTAMLSGVGRIAWLWADDNSNYLGIYTTGRLVGWLVRLNHEEPALTPAYRSVRSFLTNLLAAAPGATPMDRAAVDLVSLSRDVPVVVDDPQYMEIDREHARAFADMHVNEADENRRRLYAMSSICLTPVADTDSVVPFLREFDMCTPEAAVLLMELRRFGGALEEVERLARDGIPNGDSAAMRLLVRLGSNASRNAIARLQRQISGRKLRALEQWIRHRNQLQPPRWE